MHRFILLYSKTNSHMLKFDSDNKESMDILLSTTCISILTHCSTNPCNALVCRHIWSVCLSVTLPHQCSFLTWVTPPENVRISVSGWLPGIHSGIGHASFIDVENITSRNCNFSLKILHVILSPIDCSTTYRYFACTRNWIYPEMCGSLIQENWFRQWLLQNCRILGGKLGYVLRFKWGFNQSLSISCH